MNEVSVDEVGSDINYGFTAKYAHCNYNLLPVLQPKWLNREGVEITDGKKQDCFKTCLALLHI